jgi:hypothetical protein
LWQLVQEIWLRQAPRSSSVDSMEFSTAEPSAQWDAPDL